LRLLLWYLDGLLIGLLLGLCGLLRLWLRRHTLTPQLVRNARHFLWRAPNGPLRNVFLSCEAPALVARLLLGLLSG
jgi:hypothetical protein